jgi:uncharacterized protein (DUF433 family)
MVKQTTVVSMRLPRNSSKRLEKMARHHGWTVSDTSARLVEEGLRRSEFAFIDFRDSPVGRQAYIEGSRLPVWQVMMIARGYKGNVKAIAKHLNWPEIKVHAAMNYAEAFPDEIESALEDNRPSLEELKRQIPNLEVFIVK